MRLCVLLVFFFFLSISSSLVPCCTSQHIVAGKHVRANQSIISPTGTFALGFFSLGKSTPRYYLGIWCNKIQNKTIVWVANRESPTDSLGIFALGVDGTLMVLDATSKTVWSSNGKIANSAVNNPVGVLMDNGNLVLRSGEDILWESFDHPSDTFLAGMKLSYSHKTGQQRQLTSWINVENPQPGMFSFGIGTNGDPQLLIWKDRDPYSRSYVYRNSWSTTKLSRFQPFAYYLTFNIEADDIYVTYNASENSAILRVTLVPDGRIELLLWLEINNKWHSVWQSPSTSCNFYGRCNPFSSCDQTGFPDHCKCLTGFQPKVQREWDTRNQTSGNCVRQKKALRSDKDDGFLKIVNKELPDHPYLLGNVSANDCESRCLQNCSCTAYAYVNAEKLQANA